MHQARDVLVVTLFFMEKQLGFVGLTAHLHGFQQKSNTRAANLYGNTETRCGWLSRHSLWFANLQYCTALASMIHRQDKQWRATASSLNATRLCPSNCGLMTVDSQKSHYSCLGMHSLLCFIGGLAAPVRSLFFPTF